MNRLVLHLVLPVLMPLLFFEVALTPVELFGCRLRGVLALALATASGIAALACAIRANMERVRGEALGGWWIASTMVLAIPVVALLLMA